MKRLTLSITIAIMAAFPGSVLAAGDAVAGQQKAQVCAACHGLDGNSTGKDFPSLAGQVPGFIAQQLAKFKSGERGSALMVGMVQLLSVADMADLDAWYASQTPAPRAIGEAQLETALVGQELFRGGAKQYAVPACMACHGPDGHGVPVNYPRVAGQWPEYLESQLLAFKSGERADPVMGPIAFRLSATQIRALALYMSGLQ